MINLKERKINYSKRFVTLLIASILISSLFFGAALGFLADQSTLQPNPPNFDKADFVVLEGVAGNDYYDTRQYSYQINQWANETFCTTYPNGQPTGNNFYGDNTVNPNPSNTWFNAGKSLRIGFTEYGEFATLNNTGVAYGANLQEWNLTESWASTHIPSQYWIQGWTFYMNYTRGGFGGLRQIEAFALYSDTGTTEAARDVYSWDGSLAVNAVNAHLSFGTLIPSGVQVLYDSARLVVVRSSVTIHDINNYAPVWAEDVVKITFTVVYNKDTKYAIVYKDIKMLLDTKVLVAVNDFAFSERYEIDLARGVNLPNRAYVHWYHNYNQSVYMHPLLGTNLTDVVQAYDPAKQYIFFAGFWPSCTEYSVYDQLIPSYASNLNLVLPVGTAHPDGYLNVEPILPWITAQWRYNITQYPKMMAFLAGAPNREIRFVEVFGMTDYNKPTTGTGYSYYNSGAIPYNARDLQDPTCNINSIDTEVRYMLYGKVFVPEDLNTVDKDPFMWIGVGQSAATTDSAGAAMLPDLNQAILQEPLVLFDRADTAFPYTAPTIINKGTIPYGLSFGGSNYIESFQNTVKTVGGYKSGTDPTLFYRTGLVGFAFAVYDGKTYNPQPVAGGYSSGTGRFWYPSKDPLTERWVESFGSTAEPNAKYGNINYHPNGILTVGGMKPNGFTRYFNDFGFAISREGAAPGYALAMNDVVTGTAPTSNPSINTLDYFPISTWASSVTPTYSNTGDAAGYAVIALARDVNGTRGLSVYGWDARDTYWASAWASQYLGAIMPQWMPAGTVALILKISYTSPNMEPLATSPATAFTVVKALGTITEFGSNEFVTSAWNGYDTITGPATWNGNITPAALPNTGAYKVWWYEKLPTSSTASVQYDP